MTVPPVVTGMPDLAEGQRMHAWAQALWPICRSLTGPGVRETLAFIGRQLPGLQVHAVPSGTRAFDWTVPDEWTIRAAWIEDRRGRRWLDFRDHNLHVMGYSAPFDGWLSWAELEPHLYSLPDQPDAIPYVTSYYRRDWGFCLSQQQRDALPRDEPLRVVIDSTLAPGVLNYADLLIPGDTPDEVLLSTYVCHPSLANNELSGPVVAMALGQWLQALPRRRYSYRLVFAPETLGAVVYLSRHLAELRQRVIAGYVLTCLGDERAYSFLPSRRGNTLADRVARCVLHDLAPGFTAYSFLQRGSDERQYCSPGVDLPVASVMRSKYGTYPEYHTSHDDLSLITPAGLAGGLAALQACIRVIEGNYRYRVTTPCEPQLGKRGLYPLTSTRDTQAQVEHMMNVLAYADGELDCVGLAEVTGVPVAECLHWCETFLSHGLMERCE